MGRIFVISDLHLGDRLIAEKRGFDSVEAHDKHVMDSWNSVVLKRDVVWILGDITMEKKTSYWMLDKLKGIKKVVLGNHEKPAHVEELLKYVNFVCGMFKTKGFWFTHCPIHPSELRGKFNIHGHIHDLQIPDYRYINVSCENVNYVPQLLSKFESYKADKE